MMRIRSRARRRGGFTLIELLIVIAIIALLMSLLISGVVRVLAWQHRTETATEITKLQSALEAARSKYNNIPYFPSHLILLNDTSQYKDPDKLAAAPPAKNTVYAFTPAQVNAVKQTKVAFRYMFGRRFVEGGKFVNWVPDYKTDASGKTPLANGWVELWGGECLVFYLGGMPKRPTSPPIPGPLPVACRGFSTDPTDPTNPTTTDTLGPFYTFNLQRLAVGQSGHYYEYGDPYLTAYAFFGPIGPNLYSSDCPFTKGADGLGVDPYWDSFQGTPSKFLNPDKYQIISAGPDRCFGGGGAWNAKTGDPGTKTSDNLVNFSQTQLSEPQQ